MDGFWGSGHREPFLVGSMVGRWELASNDTKTGEMKASHFMLEEDNFCILKSLRRNGPARVLLTHSFAKNYGKDATPSSANSLPSASPVLLDFLSSA
jgi:hypothetical protein